MVENLLQYRSYRACIRDFYQKKRAARQGFSYRLFSKRAGFKSPNFIQLVIQGKRNLSRDGATRLAQAMQLSRAESEYFCGLVALEHCDGEESRQAAQKILLRATRKIVSKEIPKSKSEILSGWQHLVIRELVNLKDFRPEPSWIVARLRGLVSLEEAQKSLDLLLRCGFLKRTDEDQLEVCEAVIDTGDGFAPVQVLKMHQQTLKVWIKALGAMGLEERQLGLVNIPISRKKIPELMAKIRAFEDEVIGWLQNEKEPDQIVQMGSYLIPIST